MSKKHDLSGLKFSNLTVLHSAKDERKGTFWKCLCDCGNYAVVEAQYLKKGKTKSCGCFHNNYRKKRLGEANLNDLFSTYRKSALKRNLEFSLTRDQFEKLIFNVCKYCNNLPLQVHNKKNSNGAIFYNGIDRVDNSLGYTIDNCVSCCKKCNWMKRDFRLSDFSEHLNKISKNKNEEVSFLVTGGAGFIGSTLCDALLKLGYRVIVLDNFSTGKREYIPDAEKLEVYEVDVGDWSSLSEIFPNLAQRKISGVFHLAAQSRIQPSIINPIFAHHSNVSGTFNVLQMMRILSIGNIVYSASSSRYGRTPAPFSDTKNVDILNVYSLTKYCGELYCQTWGKTYGINNVSLAYFNVYGAREFLDGDYATVIGKFYRQTLKEKRNITIVGDGEQTRDFTHVDDVVSANICAMNCLLSNPIICSGKIYNVGTGNDISIKSLAQRILSQVVKYSPNISIEHIPERIGESKTTRADVSATMSDLNWKPSVSLSDGLSRSFEYYSGLFVK